MNKPLCLRRGLFFIKPSFFDGQEHPQCIEAVSAYLGSPLMLKHK